MVMSGEACFSSWSHLFSDLPKHLQDSYYDWEYVHLYEVPDRTTPMLFVYRDNDKTLLIPFLKHRITSILGCLLTDPINDIETPYGYGGPLSTTNDVKFIQNAHSAFLGWARDSKITAEFVRFHPILCTERFASVDMAVERIKSTYSITIDREVVALDHFRGTARNRIRGALKNGLYSHEIPIEDGMQSFQKLYLNSMQRLHAEKFYTFSSEYFERLAKMPQDKLRMLAVSDADGILSMAIFLKSSKGMHYHLGANSERKVHSGSFNLLFCQAVDVALQEELGFIHLGGGLLSDDSDSLSRFKRTISNTSHNYFIGRRVHNLENWREAQSRLSSERSPQRTMPRLLEYHFYP